MNLSPDYHLITSVSGLDLNRFVDITKPQASHDFWTRLFYWISNLRRN